MDARQYFQNQDVEIVTKPRKIQYNAEQDQLYNSNGSENIVTLDSNTSLSYNEGASHTQIMFLWVTREHHSSLLKC